MKPRRYRTKFEVLRDVLEASRHGSKKTRIIGLANLNHESFDSYVSFCLRNGLLVRRDGGYETTARAEETLGTIEVVLTKVSELDEALRALAGLISPGRMETLASDPSAVPLLRQSSGYVLASLHYAGTRPTRRPTKGHASGRSR